MNAADMCFMKKRSFEDEIRSDFIEEAQDNLDSVEQAFLKLESGDLSVVDEIFRLAHNLKGTAKAVGFVHVSQFMHSFENLLTEIKNENISVTEQSMELVFLLKDRLSQILMQLDQDHSCDIDPSGEIEKIEAFISSRPRSRLQNDSRSRDGDVKKTPQQKKKDETLRVSNKKLKNLSDAVGELVIMQSIIGQYSKSSTDINFVRATDQLSKLSKTIQELSMELFMVPIKGTLMKIQRVIRDSSKELNKPVEVLIKGETTEIAKSTIESLYEPLVHIVRNAIDHGLEDTPEQRRQLGKSEIGQIEISCFHEGGNLIIKISDDGRGIDPERVYETALKKGLVKKEVSLSDNEKTSLIFTPGFSTKKNVSTMSGRGVGMDVVMKNIRELSGHIGIESKKGEGSTFRLSLPLTVSVIDGVVGRVAGQSFVFPLSQISETVLVGNHEISYVTGLGHILNLRGESLPIWVLSEALGINGSDPTDSFYGKSVLICENAGVRFGVVVDKLEKQQQVLVKELSFEVPDRDVYLGSSILGTGLPALIIDLAKFYSNKLDGLIQISHLSEPESHMEKGA